jgi:hypothetical protein
MNIDKVVNKRIKEISEFCDIQYVKHLDYITLVLKEMYYRGKVEGLKRKGSAYGYDKKTTGTGTD